MNWTQLLRNEIEFAYASSEKLIATVPGDSLGWKPAGGDNWMTMGQLLKHLSDACGAPFRGFVTGDWGIPEGIDPAQMSPEEMLPSAEKMPAVDSVAEALQLLGEDKDVALAMLGETAEDRLANEAASAPWDPQEMILGQRLLQMIAHLTQHKAQLFYYLKLQGKPVNTGDLWGM